MPWIRSPLWDISWIWGGLFIGAVLLALPAPYRAPILMSGAVLQMSHHFSPIVMAWTSSEFRATMRQRWPVFIGLPLLLTVIMVAVGAATALGYTTYPLGRPHSLNYITDWRNPLPIIVWGWLVWNAAHFGGQWYGVSRLYLRRWKITRRCGEAMRRGFIAFAITVIVVIPLGPVFIPAIVKWLGPDAVQFWLHYCVQWTRYWPSYSNELSLWLFGAISLQHWLTDIGLTQGAVRRWWILPALLVAGSCGLYTHAWTPDVSAGHLMVRTTAWTWPIMYSLIIATSFMHFIYSRLAWRHGTPFMRAVLAHGGMSHASTAAMAAAPAHIAPTQRMTPQNNAPATRL